jgi:hypothetical protein
MVTMMVNGNIEVFEEINGKKINKTFTLTPKSVEFLNNVDRKSALINLLLEGYVEGRFIRKETAELLKKYQTIFGIDPEDALHQILSKRIQKIENNMNALKEMAPEEVKNRVGGSFLKLNKMYEQILAENKTADYKTAITYSVMFKRTGCNNQSIRKWIRANKERLEDYHQSLGIVDAGNHNRLLGIVHRVEKQRKAKENAENIMKEQVEEQNV